MFWDGFWVLDLNWNDLELEKRNSIFGEETQFCSWVILDFEALLSDGLPFPIYREGVGMFRWENERGLIRVWMWLEACLKVGFFGKTLACSNQVCTPNHMVVLLSIKQVQQSALIWPAIGLSFYTFWEISEFCMWLGFLIWWPPCTQVDF